MITVIKGKSKFDSACCEATPLCAIGRIDSYSLKQMSQFCKEIFRASKLTEGLPILPTDDRRVAKWQLKNRTGKFRRVSASINAS